MSDTTKDFMEPPPYAEHAGQGDFSFSSQAQNVQTQRIDTVTEVKILPLIHNRVSQGYTRTAIALLPTSQIQPANDSTALPPNILGLVSHEDDDLQLIELDGDMGHMSFWTQKGVVDKLRKTLEGHLLPNAAPPARETPLQEGQRPEKGRDTPRPVPSPTLQRSKWSFSKSSSRIKEGQPPAAASSAPVTKADGRGVKIELDDVSLRVESDFGLYDTLTKTAIVVRVDIS